MAPRALVPVGSPFTFKKNLPLLNQNASLGFSVTGDLRPDLLAVLTSETAPFPARDIGLVEISLTTSTAAPIEFARGSDKVTFSASAEAFAGFGSYRTGARLLGQLGEAAEDFTLTGLEFGAGSESVLGVLRWGYAAEAKGSGAVALGAVGKATAQVSGKSTGLFAVIRRFPSNTPARAVVQATADSWLMPRQIASVDQVDPGTWIVAEVMGALAVKLGAQLGYDFNWVRAAKLGGLTGDIGLRLQMGINAAVGFAISGRSAVVVSRESDAKALRLRIFRLGTRQVDASLNAKLSVKAIDRFLPDRVDDFIAAVFDTHGQQILRDLKVLQEWTDPNRSLSELLANAGIDGAERLIARLAGVSPDALQMEFDAIHKKAVSFVQEWHRLPHTVASTVLKMVEDKVDLASVREVAKALSTITPEKLRELLDTQLTRIDFFHTPAGRLLESIAGNGVLSLAARPLDELQAIGSQVATILDGSATEQTLVSFQSFVESELRLDRVFAVVTETDFAHLDALLKRKLAAFLGQDTVVLRDLEKVRQTIRLLLDKREEYYEKAIEALHRKYNFAMNAAYTEKTTDEALLDATFDFSHDPASVAGFFQQAVQGNFEDLLTTQPAQVSIGAGRLSHGVRRQTHVDVSLPFVDLSEVHLNESLASLEAVPESGGLLFKLNASDTVASNQRTSILSLAMGLSAMPGSGDLRLHRDSLEMNYALLFARRNMQLKHVRAQVEPAVTTFFASRIPDVDGFLRLLDSQTEEAIPNGPNLLGNGLIALQVSLASAAAKRAGEAWLGLPANRAADEYTRMSNAIQRSLKQNLHGAVFSSPEAYTNAIGSALTVLAYCAIVPRAPKVTGRGAPFWDFEDRSEVRAMLGKPQTVAKMTELLTRAQVVLLGESAASFFKPAAARSILADVDASGALLHSLLFSEAEIVRHAFEAGLAIAASRGASPRDAIKALAKFGSKLTEAFNADITTLLGPGIQPLGTRVFLDASRAIAAAGGTAAIAEANAMLNIEFLKPDATFDAAALLKAGRIASAALAFADRVVSLPS